ncbi:MAG TPA: hypothetical protein PKD74_02180 [Candidatus Dependentiae bacterium]|nr:hypothetical protein [Candidatus Dependentiae bacterium]
MLLNNSYTHEQSSNHNNTSKRIKSLLLLSLSCIALSYAPKSNAMSLITYLGTQLIGTLRQIVAHPIASGAVAGGAAVTGFGYHKLTKRIDAQDEKNKLLEATIQETTKQLEELTAQQSKLLQEGINAAMAKLSEQHPGLIESIKTSLGTALSYVATPVTGGWALAKKIPLKKCLKYVYEDVVKKHPYISATAIVLPTLLLIKKMYGEQIYIALTSQLHLTAPQEAPAAPREEDLHDDAA